MMRVNSDTRDALKAIAAGSSIYMIAVAVYVLGFNALVELDGQSILAECPAINSCGAGLFQMLWFTGFFFVCGVIAIKMKKTNAMLTLTVFVLVSVLVDTLAYQFLIWNMQDHRYHLLVAFALVGFFWEKHLACCEKPAHLQ